jgi:hypothetical protein
VFYESPKSEFFDFNVEEIDYVDDILSNSFINDCDESYTVEENFRFTREEIIDSFLKISMPCEEKKLNKACKL